MHLGSARSFYSGHSRSLPSPSTLITRMFAALLLLVGTTIATQSLTTGAAQAETERELLPVSSDGSTLDTATLDMMEKLPDVDAIPATTPSKSPDDVGASFDPDDLKGETDEFGTFSIIGDDERTRTTPTDWHPAAATVQFTLVNDAGNRVQYCSGFMISPDTVATAGHCVYNEDAFGGWVSGRQFLAFPGRDGTDAPYGSCAAVSFYSVNFWTEDGDSEYDYGAVKLDCTVGDATGTYGYYWQSASLDGTGTSTRGYPGDQAFGTQWASYDQIRETHDRQVFYQNDTVGGQSGSPVYTYRDSCNGPCAMAVHAYGCRTSGTCNDDDPPFTNHNYGTRITEEVFGFFQAWSAL